MGALITILVAGLLCVIDVISYDVFGCIALGSVVWALVAAWLYMQCGLFKFFYHGLLGWHRPDYAYKIWNDGCSEHAICKYCGKEIMQDSQGNWFAKDEILIIEDVEEWSKKVKKALEEMEDEK